MFKKVFDVIQYSILVLLVIATANAIYINSLPHIFSGSLLVLFWASMIFENKFPNKNKLISTIYYLTLVIIILINLAYIWLTCL